MTKKMLIILIAAGVLLLGLMGGGFYVVVNKISALVPQPQEARETKMEKEEAQKEVIGSLLALDAFVVNLSDPGAKRYLRTAMSLEIQDEKKVEDVKKRLPQIRHLILMELSAKKLDDIQSVEGKTALRDQLITDLNKLLKEPLVKSLYFTEFVVQ